MGTAFRLYWEFFKTGLFSVGGGLATLPFLIEMSARTGWFTSADIADMVAISESTPGPLGINMGTYVGYKTIGLFGGVVVDQPDTDHPWRRHLLLGSSRGGSQWQSDTGI